MFWMSLVLVFALIAGLALPAANVSAASKEKTTTKKVLVVYFSGTGNTRSAAKKIKDATGGKLYEIKAEDPYTSEDLDYSNDNCRANAEQNDESVRPEINGKVKNIRKYDVIFLGYPICSALFVVFLNSSCRYPCRTSTPIPASSRSWMILTL